MATPVERLQDKEDKGGLDTIPGVDLLTPGQAREIFDRRAMSLLSMSGEEFLRRWDAGEYRPIPDSADGRAIGELVMMMSFARRTQS